MARVSSKGQITIPAGVRDSAGIGPGQDVTFTALGNGKIIVRRKSGTLADLRGIVKTKRRVPTDELRVGGGSVKPRCERGGSKTRAGE